MSDIITVTTTLQIDRDEMRRRGRLGALVKHSRHDPAEHMSKARDVFNARFEKEVDPEGILPAEERQRRAAYARQAYFQRLAMKSASARKRRKKPAA
jgi:hypothetical protein